MRTLARDPENIRPEQLDRLPAPGSSKRDRGDVLVVGGARKTPGAAALAGIGALRVGAGRLTLGVAASVAAPLAVSLPEAGVIGLPESPGGTVLGSAAESLADELEADCLVVGPGLDDIDEAAALLAALVPLIGEESRVLLDAYALGALVHEPDLCRSLEGRLVLTPNPTEAALLLNREAGDPADDLIEVAARFGAIVSGQGLIVEPSGRIRAVEAGGPGLGTSGSGDVLAGAIAGLVARGAETAEAVCWATYLHAAAGDRLSARIGPLGFLARELADELPVVLAQNA